MKKLVFSLVAIITLTMSSCAQKIAIVEKDNYKIVVDTDPIKKSWEEMLKKQDNPAVLGNFKVVSDKIDKTDEVYYMLIATNADQTIKVGHVLELKDGVLYYFNKKASASLSDSTCSCSGCRDGCNPGLKADGHFICSPCIEGTGCTKTETF